MACTTGTGFSRLPAAYAMMLKFRVRSMLYAGSAYAHTRSFLTRNVDTVDICIYIYIGLITPNMTSCYIRDNPILTYHPPFLNFSPPSCYLWLLLRIHKCTAALTLVHRPSIHTGQPFLLSSSLDLSWKTPSWPLSINHLNHLVRQPSTPPQRFPTLT